MCTLYECLTFSLIPSSTVAALAVPLEAVVARVHRLPAVRLLRVRASDDPRADRIVGGSKTTIESVPYQVSLRYFNNHICGGSIISHSWVLTAAHCLDWYPNNDEVSRTRDERKHAPC